MIKFVEDRDVRDHLGRVVQSFRRGQVVELTEASERRWIRRRLAVHVQGAAAPSHSVDGKGKGTRRKRHGA